MEAFIATTNDGCSLGTGEHGKQEVDCGASWFYIHLCEKGRQMEPSAASPVLVVGLVTLTD